ncbi:MAG: hypothetical protein IIU35_00390 [Neisseriaceae bacterium]|nr:hypothetical protein [Neisseriaceae bacterium]MBQ5428843.1 hypothetical protein [Neisseriaceae bacterium]
MKKYIALCLLAGFSLAANATIYECFRGGETVYTNKSGSNCRAMEVGKLGSYSPVKTSHSHDYSYASSSTSSNRSSGGIVRTSRSGTASERVQPEIQSQRDSSRAGILKQELANEQQALSIAQKNLADGKAANKDAATIAALEGAIRDRQENITALQKEISRM